jgi:signal transduction histidine kinase
VALRLAVDGGDVRIEVLNGRPQRTFVGDVPGSGRGLAGMRERARACGGDLDAGPTEDGGFAVAARLRTGVTT